MKLRADLQKYDTDKSSSSESKMFALPPATDDDVADLRESKPDTTEVETES